MPRVPRSFSVRPQFSVHKIWRGHNRESNLETTQQKQRYLDLLNEDLESERFLDACELHALTLMSNHTHEVSKILEVKSYSNHMRRHHARYGAYFNRQKGRCGKVAQDRPKTCLIADESHEMRVVFYIHANPIRAGLVKDARNYYWSTHRLYAFGKREPWMKHIVLPAWYTRLGDTPKQRQRAYRRLFAQYLRTQGRSRQRFLHKLFYGPDLWIDQNQQAVGAWLKAHAPP